MKRSSVPHERPRLKRTQIEGVIVEQPYRLGVRGQKNLKAAIELEPLDMIRPNSSTDPIGCFQNPKSYVRLLQPERTAQARKTSPLRSLLRRPCDALRLFGL